MNIPFKLKEKSEINGQRLALIENKFGIEHSVTFAELDKSSDELALYFKKQGLKYNDTALVLHSMCIELYNIIFALFKLGVKAMLVDPSSGLPFMETCFEIERPHALITSSRGSLLPFVSGGVQDIPMKFRTGMGLFGFKPIYLLSIKVRNILDGDASQNKIDLDAVQGELPALITFTSGSTGRPKGIIRTHDFLLHQHKALEESLSLKEGAVEMTALPIFVLANLASGMTSIIPNINLRKPGKADGARLLQQIGQYKTERIVAPPALLERLSDYCIKHKCTANSLLKIFTGGGPVFPKLMRRLKSIAPHADIIAVYGSTEAEPIAHIALSQINEDDFEQIKSGAGLLAGLPETQVQLHIVKPLITTEKLQHFSLAEFDAMKQASNVPGEIVVTGGHVIKGYVRGQGDSQAKFKVDNQVWHRTGDAGYLDNKGRLWLLGRESAKIVDTEGVLYPFQAEGAASEHISVKRAACVSNKGKRTLVIQLHDTFYRRQRAEVQEIIAILKHNLQSLKIAEIHIHNRIPVDRRHNSKVDYAALIKSLHN